MATLSKVYASDQFKENVLKLNLSLNEHSVYEADQHHGCAPGPPVFGSMSQIYKLKLCFSRLRQQTVSQLNICDF